MMFVTMFNLHIYMPRCLTSLSEYYSFIDSPIAQDILAQHLYQKQ